MSSFLAIPQLKRLPTILDSSLFFGGQLQNEDFLKDDSALKVYSRVDPSVLLSVLFRPKQMDSRVDLTSREALLQVATIPLTKGTRVLPHKHNAISRETIGTSEAWVVMVGSIKIEVFDLDATFLGDWVLMQGSIAVLLNGGHGATSLDEGTLVFEFKNGPYLGADADKSQIRE